MHLSLGTWLLVITVFVAGIGTGYGLWSKTLTVDVTVGTGNVLARFASNPFTDDDGTVNDATKDGPSGVGALQDDDLGETKDANQCGVHPTCSSADPAAAGPNPARGNNDVAVCTVQVNAQNSKRLDVTITKAYANYWCSVYYGIENYGTIPLKLKSATLAEACVDANANNVCDVGEAIWTPASQPVQNDGPLYITLTNLKSASGLNVAGPGESSTQVEDGSTHSADLHVHVEQSAVQGARYRFVIEMEWAQWNEVVR